MLVRASQPFKITGRAPNREDITAAPDADDAKPAHTVNLTLKVPNQVGPFNAVVEIDTDVRGEPPLKVNTFATVVP